MSATRRLAAILAADVAGYSRLIGADEEGTLRRLKAIRAELIDPKLSEHHGRIVKTTGDGLLVEFASVVDALRCASEWQRGSAERNAGTPGGSIEFRIGVHQGDVVVEDGDIFGDGVNVAARLEGLAEPGGICVSARVQEDAAGRLDLAFEDMGEQSLKNIARPVRVYALRPGAIAALPAASAPAAASARQSAVAPRLSIVVLPFTNLSNDPEQLYFADGITEDLTTDLSRIEGSFVISRNTAFTYRGKPIDTKQIGRELGVRYVLEGSVRRSGNQIRVNAQLIDAESDTHVWAERFDRNTSDLFGLQDEITGRIAVALNHAMVGAEVARPTEHPDALDYILRGRAAGWKLYGRDNYAEAIGLYERALALDPHSVEAQCRLASALVSRVLNGMTESAEADIELAVRLAGEALAASPQSPLAHFAKAQVLRAQGRPADAIREYETVLAFDRNWAEALAAIGRCKIYIGPIEEAIPAQEQAIRLSPRDPAIGNWHFRIGQAHLLQSRIDEAITSLEKARSAGPALPFVRAWLAAAYALNGETEPAAAELAEACRLSGDGSYSSISRLRNHLMLNQSRGARPEIRALFETAYIAGLRKAGMPEE
jgi:adenylate cyclase